MPTDESEDHYAILGIEPHTDDAELRRVFRALALRWHPDHAGPDTAHIFRRLQAAYAVLSDPLSRAAYDRQRGIVARPETPAAGVSRRAPGTPIRRLSAPLDALLARGVARRETDDRIELFVTGEEVAEGGMITISMRVPVRCDPCGGRACSRCGGAGEIDDLFAAWLALRPGVVDGAVLRPSAQLPGVIRPVTFRVRVVAEPGDVRRGT